MNEEAVTRYNGSFRLSAFTCAQENQIPVLLWLHKMHMDTLNSTKIGPETS